MYNRYIPQPDGSYRKNRMPDLPQQKRPRPQSTPPSSTPCEAKPQHTPPPSKCEPPRHTDAGDFLRRLLPKELDTGDLLIILLLLLMAGDCREDKNTALLTLALYFFL